MKSWIIPVLLLVLISLVLWFGLRDNGVVIDYGSVRGIDSLKETTRGRDSIIDRSHDTVIYQVTKVQQTIVEYRTERDTILKLIICDSLAHQAELLSGECRRNDSIHLIQESDLKLIISKQDTVITGLVGDNKKLKRNNRILSATTVILGIVAILK